jgi:hypothetical protein
MNWNVTAFNNEKKNSAFRKCSDEKNSGFVLVSNIQPSFNTKSKSPEVFFNIKNTKKLFFLASYCCWHGESGIGANWQIYFVSVTQQVYCCYYWYGYCACRFICQASRYAKMIFKASHWHREVEDDAIAIDWFFFYYLLFTSSFSLLSTIFFIILSYEKVRKNNRNFYLKIF